MNLSKMNLGPAVPKEAAQYNSERLEMFKMDLSHGLFVYKTLTKTHNLARFCVSKPGKI